ncbi:hypothetical protein [Nocardia carnea]|uniref:hypothetical protein n=1 Tax=Nocardia carnea TaxID=37328 RepID=UPI0024564A80|nr:hypothetical protein [Nocardia carnea]
MPETATDPMILAAEQADAEAAAAEAEALAAQASATAARARARAAKLRREAGEHRAAAADAESATAGSAAGSADSGISDPGPTANTTDTDAVGESGSVADESERVATAAASATEAASSGAKAASPESPGSEPTVTQAEDASSATPERGTAARSGSHAEVSLTEGSGSDTSADSRSSRGASKGSDSAAVTKNRASKVAGRLAAAGRRVKSSTVRRPSGRAVARAVVAVIVLVSLAAGGYSIWNHQQITAAQAREDEFLNAAREGVIALTTLDSGKAADDVKRVLDHSTGAFRTDFQTRSEDFTKVVEQSKVATQGEITAAAVESMTDESAVVLVSAVSRVTNTAGAQQEPRVWRLSVTVTREDSELKMSKVEFVP